MIVSNQNGAMVNGRKVAISRCYRRFIETRKSTLGGPSERLLSSSVRASRCYGSDMIRLGGLILYAGKRDD